MATLVTTIEKRNASASLGSSLVTDAGGPNSDGTLVLQVGDLVVVGVCGEETAGSNGASVGLAISDTLGNTYVSAGRVSHGSSPEATLGIFYCIVPSGKSGTTAITAAISNFPIAWSALVVGQGRPDSGKTFVFDNSTTAQGNGTAVSAGALAIDGSQGGFMAAFVKALASASPWSSSWATGFLGPTASGVDAVGGYKLVSSGTSETATFTGPAANWLIGAIHVRELGGGYTLTAAAGSYTLSGQDAQFTENLGTSGNVSGLVVGSGLSFVGASYVGAKDAAPAGGGGTTLVAAQGSYSLNGQAAITRVGRRLTAAFGSYAFSGYDALVDLSITAQAGSYSLSGQAATLVYSAGAKILAAAQGSYTLSGQAAALRIGRKLVAVQGGYTLTGQAAALRATRTLLAAQGSYALTGQIAGLKVGRLLVAAQGSYSLTGQAAALRDSRALAAAQGAYALNGQAATLTYSAGAKILTAAQGSYSLAGQTAGLLAARRVTASQGAYALSGQAANLVYTPASKTLVAAQGSYSLIGQVATLRDSRRMTAVFGTYALGGQLASLRYGRVMALAAGAYTLTGQVAQLRISHRIVLAAGAYTFSGQAVALAYSGQLITESTRIFARARELVLVPEWRSPVIVPPRRTIVLSPRSH